MSDAGADDRVTVSIRLPMVVHRAASVAAARSGKSLNVWLTDLAAAASSTANAAALLIQVRDLKLSDEGALSELTSRFHGLIMTALDHTAGQLSEIRDVLLKMAGQFESMQAAEEIRSSRTG